MRDPFLEDIVYWTTSVAEIIDDDNEIEVDHVPVHENLVATVKALEFALHERLSILKLDLTSEVHANRR